MCTINITVGMAVGLDEAVQYFEEHDDPWMLKPDLTALRDEIRASYLLTNINVFTGKERHHIPMYPEDESD